MLENKVLVNLYIVSLGKNFEVYLPINEKVGNVAKLINTTLFDSINYDRNCVLYNTENSSVYENNKLIRETDIKNGSKLILI